MLRKTLAKSPDAEAIRKVLRAAPLLRGGEGSVFVNPQETDFDLSKIHPEYVSQLALNIHRKYLEQSQWDKANSNQILEQKDKQLRQSHDRLNDVGKRVRELECENERLKQHVEKLNSSDDYKSQYNRQTSKRVCEGVNGIRKSFVNEWKALEEEHKSQWKVMDACRTAVNEHVFKKLLTEFTGE